MKKAQGALNETLVGTEHTDIDVYKVSGWHSKKVKADLGDDVLYTLRNKCFSWRLSAEFYTGDPPKGTTPLYSFRQKRGTACKTVLLATDSSQQPVASIESSSGLRIKRTFSFNGKEYGWQSVGSWLSFSYKLALVEIKSSVVLAEYQFGCAQKGTLRISCECGIPKDFVIASVLAIEAQFRNQAGISAASAHGGAT